MRRERLPRFEIPGGDPSVPRVLSRPFGSFFLNRRVIVLRSNSHQINDGRSPSNRGTMELKRIFSFPSSNARDFGNLTVAARTLFESTRLGNGCFTVYEVNVSTLAESDFRKNGNAARMSRTWLIKEVSTAFCQVASSTFRMSPKVVRPRW